MIEVSVAAMRLVLSGMMERHPKLKVVMSHTGGALPYQSGRMDKNTPKAKLPKPASTYLKRMYTDTVSPHAAGMKFAIEYYGIDNVMYGTDYPCWEPAQALKLIDELKLSAAGQAEAVLRQRPAHPRPARSGAGEERRARAGAGEVRRCIRCREARPEPNDRSIRRNEQRTIHASRPCRNSTQIASTRTGKERQFKTLLTGEDGALDNFRLYFVRQQGEVDVPRHKHNFDQIRMCLEGGKQNYGKDKWIAPGEIAYFPEGTPYGPEQSNTERLSITLQFGGASRSGFISSARVQKAMDEMKEFGTFEKGIFKRTGQLAPGEKRNQDAYEAIWEHVNKRKLVYPKPRYGEPILMKPENFEWEACEGPAGLCEEASLRLLRTQSAILDRSSSSRAHAACSRRAAASRSASSCRAKARSTARRCASTRPSRAARISR